MKARGLELVEETIKTNRSINRYYYIKEELKINVFILSGEGSDRGVTEAEVDKNVWKGEKDWRIFPRTKKKQFKKEKSTGKLYRKKKHDKYSV